jgi:hypothetical protein
MRTLGNELELELALILLYEGHDRCAEQPGGNSEGDQHSYHAASAFFRNRTIRNDCGAARGRGRNIG